MQDVIATVQPYLPYALPPIIGAFIGYLTNRVAIKMLFRPLKPWKIFGIRVPMTPGVIPSKRHELAVNMGAMVGEHLLTSEEIGKALKKETFQSHLLKLIKSKVGAILDKDLGPLPSIIPAKFKVYFDVAVTTVKYQIKEGVTGYIQSDKFENLIKDKVASSFDDLVAKDFKTLVSGSDREIAYGFVAERVEQMVKSNAVELYINEYVRHKVYGTIQQRKSLSEVLPESIQELLVETIINQTPVLLQKLGEMTAEPEIRNKIVSGVKEGVDNFIESMGPMSGMVRNFLTMETVELKVREYLEEKEDEIIATLQDQDVQDRVSNTLKERCLVFFNNPIVEILSEKNDESVELFCDSVAKQLIAVLQEKETVDAVVAMLKNTSEHYLEEENPSLKDVLESVLGGSRVESTKKWLIDECISLFRAQSTLKAIDDMLGSLVNGLLERPIGQLSKLLPAGVRDGMYVSLQGVSSNMLASEVPGLVHSLNIQRIVTEKIDSLDLLKLEKLLLSIMEEQFKYINLFGALLGFIIGCFNLIVIVWS